jgi:hypothetical protein
VKESRSLLLDRIPALAGEGRLAIETNAAADLLWAFSHAAALLYVMGKPNPIVIDALRERALAIVVKPKNAGKIKGKNK